MSWNKILSVCGVVATVGLVIWLVCVSLASQFRQEEKINKAHYIIAMMVLDAREIGRRTEALMEEVEALTTPMHKEALLLIGTWGEICAHVPLSRRVGNVVCGLVALDGFPDRQFRLAVWRNLGVVRALTINQCEMVGDNKPTVCMELGIAPSAVVRGVAVPH